MKSAILCLSATGLLLATMLAGAQTGNSSETPTGGSTNAEKQAMEHVSQKDPANNMVVSDMNSFDTMDSGKKGMVSMDQAHGDPWLAKNFKTCDKNGDGMVSRQEYAGCRAIK